MISGLVEKALLGENAEKLENMKAYTQLLINKVKFEWDKLSEVERTYIKYLVYGSLQEHERWNLLKGLKYSLVYLSKKRKYGHGYDEFLELIQELNKETLDKIESLSPELKKDLEVSIKEAMEGAIPLEEKPSVRFSRLLED